MKRTTFWKFAYIGATVAVFFLDQVTKAWAAKSIRFNGSMELIPNFLSFSYATNPGVAFSMFDGHGESGRWALSFVALLAAVLVLYFFWRTPRSDDRLLSALALILAGILGNAFDRIRLGFVIDFIDFQFGGWHYPTFNVADIAICIGAGLLVLDMFLGKNVNDNTKKEKTEGAET
ncbi:MAG: signal peptidase II [Pyrinomonadaceae bacterium]